MISADKVGKLREWLIVRDEGAEVLAKEREDIRLLTQLPRALNAYAKGERNHPTMVAQAKSFSAQDIADIAAYVSALKPAK